MAKGRIGRFIPSSIRRQRNPLKGTGAKTTDLSHLSGMVSGMKNRMPQRLSAPRKSKASGLPNMGASL